MDISNIDLGKNGILYFKDATARQLINSLESSKASNESVQTLINNILSSIPNKTSQLINDGNGTSNFATLQYVINSIEAIPTPDVSGQIAAHNQNNEAHQDIRLLLDTKQSIIDDLNTIRNGASAGATAVQPSAIGDLASLNNIDYESNYITNKPNLSNFITNTVNSLTNYYLKTETYTQSEVNALIAAIKTIKVEIVTELPGANTDTYFNTNKTIYMISNSSTNGNNYYDEYITIRSGSEGNYIYSWENIGSTQIDLSGYVQKTITIAGISLNNNILANDLKIALNISNIKNGTGTKSVEQIDNQSLGTNSMAIGEGTIAGGRWAVAEGRGNNFEVKCLRTTTTSSLTVYGEKANEIRKNAVIFYNNSFNYVDSVATDYEFIPQQTPAPTFELNKYYYKDGSNYILLTEEPENWEIYYTLYYYISGYILSLNGFVDSVADATVKVFMGAALASNSHSGGTFCNTVYLDATTIEDENEVQRNFSTGSRNLSTGYCAVSVGEYTRSLAKRTISGGSGTSANANDSMAFNHNTEANAKNSTALGDTTLANCESGLSAGKYNAGSSSGLFEVGNGTFSARHTAFEVNTNGKCYNYAEPTPSDSENTMLNIKGLKNFIAIQNELTTQNQVDLAFKAGFYKVVNVGTMPANYGELLSIPYVGGNGINQYGAQMYFPNGDSANRNTYWYRTCNGATQSGDTIIPNWNTWQTIHKEYVVNEYHDSPTSVTHENITPNTTYVLGYVSKLAFSISSAPSHPDDKVIFHFVTSPQGTPVIVYRGGSETWYDYVPLPENTPVTLTCEYRDNRWVATTNLNGGEKPVTVKPTYNWDLRKSFNTSTHQLEYSAYQCATQAIAVTGGQSITFTTSKQIIEYDSNMNYVDYWGGSNQFPGSRTITLHNNTAYVKLVTEMAYANQSWMQIGGQYIFRASNYADFYLPFTETDTQDTNLLTKIKGYSNSGTKVLKIINGNPQYTNESVKVWRKIYDRTLSATESGVDITQDLDNNTFEITDFRMTIYIPADAGNTNSGYLRFKGDAETNFGALYGSTNYGTTSQNCLNVYEGHIKAGQPFFLEFTENMAQATASRANVMRSLSNTVNYYTYISGIQLYRNAGNFPIGTKIVVYALDK